MYTAITTTVYRIVGFCTTSGSALFGQEVILWTGRNTTRAVARKALNKLIKKNEDREEYGNLHIETVTEEVEVFVA